MNKVSVVLYYWILVAAALLFARTFGLADNNSAIIKILIVITIIYAGVVMMTYSKAKKMVESQTKARQKGNFGTSNMARKKKK